MAKEKLSKEREGQEKLLRIYTDKKGAEGKGQK